MRLIDADALKKKYAKWYNVYSSEKSIKAVTTAEIDWMPTIGGCISVKDRLPDEDGCYLAYGRYGWCILFYDSSESGWLNMGYRVADGEVTNWMPLPEPPEEEMSKNG